MLFRWDALTDTARLEDGLARSYATALNRALEPRRLPLEPAVDIVDEGSAFVLSAEVPGMSAEQLDVQVDGNVLVLSGERRTEVRETPAKVHRAERPCGAFRRSFVLPKAVDGEAIQATLRDGVLELRLPKKSVAEKRKITVQTA
jgi:HSP20 family protein